ncbi:MAG: hypothetical protein K2W93_22020, partial [Burkholderiaceae bacterium]|nr:hypothetical protein [Burkholderiaceae bacterium]
LQLGQDAKVQLRGSSVRLSNSSAFAAPTVAKAGKGQLLVQAAPRSGAAADGTSLDLVGQLQIAGASAITLATQGDLRLHGVLNNAGASAGQLRSDADLTLSAAQIYGSSATNFLVDVSGRKLTMQRAEGTAVSKPAAPLSGGAALTFKAQDIVQDGVLRAPLGSLTLQAERELTLTPTSLTSVSGDGLLLPFGSTTGGAAWYYGSPSNQLKGLPAKQISLSAANLNLAASGKLQAQLDMSGGGALQGLEFVAGPGGSSDVFAGAAGGAFAIVPDAAKLAPLDLHIALQKDANGAVADIPAGRQLLLSRDLQFGDQLLKAGRYAVMPARYALLPGSFLVKPAAVSTTVSANTAVTQANGAVLAGASFATAGTDLQDTRPSAFTITPSAVARKSSEIRSSQADSYFSQQAKREGKDLPPLAIDAGSLNLSAPRMTMQAALNYAHAAQAGAGELNIGAARLVVSERAELFPDALVLSPQALSASGAGSIMLGGTRAQDAATGQRQAAVSAQTVQIDAGVSLQAADLVLMAQQSVEVGSGAHLSAAASSSAAGSATPAKAADTLYVNGDGASLRLSAAPTAVQRSGVPAQAMAQGQVRLAAGSELKAGAQGSLSLEAAARTLVDEQAALDAGRLVLGAGRIVVGGAGAAGDT